MRDQYAGDISDFLKFSLLRALVGTDRTLGVAWYYVPGHDGRADGQHTEWRDERKWQQLDPQLYAALSTLPERSIAALESAPIWPNRTLFYREPVPARFLRDEWGKRKRTALVGSDLIFLDPDNGLGTKKTLKHATFSELLLLREQRGAIVFIKFPGRNKPHDALVQHLHERLRTDLDVKTVITLRTNVSVPHAKGSPYLVQRQRWFTIIDPDAELIARTRTFFDALSSIPRVRVHLDGIE